MQLQELIRRKKSLTNLINKSDEIKTEITQDTGNKQQNEPVFDATNYDVNKTIFRLQIKLHILHNRQAITWLVFLL